MAGYAEIYAQGWDKIREQRLVRQIKSGLLPADTPLTPRSKIPHPVASKRLGSWTEDGNNPPWDSLPAERRADLAQRMAVYAGMVTGMDRNIGRIVADLRASGDIANTLILFLSDNGACAEWEPFGFEMEPTPDPERGTGLNQGTQALPNRLHTAADLAALGQPGSRPSYGSAWANACNTPWRLYKHYGHEGGIGTPLIAHWPAGVQMGRQEEGEKGRLCGEPAHLVDIMATCADLAGAKYPGELQGHAIHPMEGLSLRPALISPSLPISESPRLLCWEHEGNRALREGRWKLVSLAGAAWELYDMDTDRAEMHDLAARDPERVKDLAAKWDAWAARTHVLPRPGDPKK